MDEIPSIEDVMSYDVPRLKMILDMRKVKYSASYTRIDYLALALSTLGYDCPYLNIEDVELINNNKKVDIGLPRILRTLFTVQRNHVNIMTKILRDRMSAIEPSDTGTGKTIMSLSIGTLLDKDMLIITPSRVIGSWLDVITTNQVQKVIGVCSYERLVSSQKYYDPYEYKYDSEEAKEAAEEGEEYNPMKKMKAHDLPFLKRVVTKEKKSDEGNNKKGTRGRKKKRDSFVWRKLKNTLVILDEAQMAKNKNTLNSELVISCYEYIKSHPERGNKLLLVTATPTDKIEHIPYLAYILNLIPKVSKKEVTSLLRTVKGDSPFIKLNSIIYDPLHPLGHKITKDEVEEVLGLQYPVSVTFQAFEMDKKAEEEIEKQNKLIAELLQSLRDKESGSALAEIVTARRIIELQKVPTFASLARKALDRRRSVIIFVEYHGTSQALMKKLKKYDPRIITGDVPITERDSITRGFREGKFDLLIMHIGVGGVGISLHDIVGGKPRSVIISPTWGGITLVQALGRADRLCKKSDVEQTIVYAKSAVEGETSMDQRLAEVMTTKLKNIKELDMGESADAFMRKLYTQASKKINVGKSPTKITIDISTVVTKKNDICELENSQKWPLDGVKVVVFDFDGVITHGNSCKTRKINVTSIIKYLMPYLQQKGYIIAIASFAKRSTIQMAISGINITIPDELIITPVDVGWTECTQPPPDRSKNDMLKLIATRTDTLPEYITLLDDTLLNIENAVNAGYCAIYITQLSPDGGLIDTHLGGVRTIDGNMDIEEFKELWSNWIIKDGYWAYGESE